MEEQAWREIDTLDRFERLSIAGEPSLDEAKADFDECQDRETAQIFRDTADVYFLDGMIEADTWDKYMEATLPFIQQEQAA
jgi:hypothetical protein